MIKNCSALLTFAFMLCTAGCSINPVTLESEFNVVSESKEVSIGRGADPQIIQQFGYYRNPALQNYVDGVGQKLARVCRRHDIPYHFTVLDTDMENAFAVPGGYIYITRGLLALMNNEAELAGVLGHEVGHVVGRDSATLMSQSMIAQIAVLAGAAGAATGGGSPELAAATSQLFNSIMLGYSREKEYLADEQSVDYVMRSGYDPMQMAAFLRTLSFSSQGYSGEQQYLTTHPYIFDRISRVQAKAKVTHAMDNAMGQLQNRPELPAARCEVLGEKYLSMIDGLAYGPREGLRHIKIYTVASGDTFETIARKTMGTSVQAKKLAQLNGLPEGSQLVPGVKIKTIY
jgi:predicted Zn-dependent protease